MSVPEFSVPDFLDDPLRYLFGPAPDEPRCMALMPSCMGYLPYLWSQYGFGS